MNTFCIKIICGLFLGFKNLNESVCVQILSEISNIYVINEMENSLKSKE